MHSRSLGGCVVVVALLTLAPRPALAGAGEHGGHHEGKAPVRHSIPEFDPSAAGGIAAIVLGGALLLARRRKG